MPNKARVFWPAALCLLLADCASKRIVAERLTPSVPHDVLGSALRFTLAYNRGTAFGLAPGPTARAAVVLLTCGALAVLFGIYRRAAASDRLLALALGLTVGGALGNLTDRVRSANGVVDFIDAGAGPVRFWIFNVADVGVTTGALLLAFAFWKRGAVTLPEA